MPYVYVLVNKVVPQNLTLYQDGAAKYVGIPVNSGAPGADTTDGTFAVFEHVRYSDMKGTNPDGTTYNDPNVPYASYFNGGDALHGFIRASYGTPQSNGCIEMPLRRRGPGLAPHPDRHPGDHRGAQLRDRSPSTTTTSTTTTGAGDDADDRLRRWRRRPLRPRAHADHGGGTGCRDDALRRSGPGGRWRPWTASRLRSALAGASPAAFFVIRFGWSARDGRPPPVRGRRSGPRPRRRSATS